MLPSRVTARSRAGGGLECSFRVTSALLVPDTVCHHHSILTTRYCHRCVLVATTVYRCQYSAELSTTRRSALPDDRDDGKERNPKNPSPLFKAPVINFLLSL